MILAFAADPLMTTRFLGTFSEVDLDFLRVLEVDIGQGIKGGKGLSLQHSKMGIQRPSCIS